MLKISCSFKINRWSSFETALHGGKSTLKTFILSLKLKSQSYIWKVSSILTLWISRFSSKPFVLKFTPSLVSTPAMVSSWCEHIHLNFAALTTLIYVIAYLLMDPLAGGKYIKSLNKYFKYQYFDIFCSKRENNQINWNFFM